MLRLVLLAMLPVVIIIVGVIARFKELYKEYQESIQISNNLIMLNEFAELIFQIQEERAQEHLFIAGGLRINWT